jgi:hypothetical protein
LAPRDWVKPCSKCRNRRDEGGGLNGGNGRLLVIASFNLNKRKINWFVGMLGHNLHAYGEYEEFIVDEYGIETLYPKLP